MAVARFILASIAIALVAAQNIDCTNAPAPSGANMNYFAPSSDCRAANTDVEACFTQWTQCTGNATACDAVNVCLQSVLICLDNIPAPAVVNTSSPCNAWNESFSNVKMYLDMGGAYSGSGLEGACKYAACTYIATVPKNGSACAVPATTCSAAPKSPPKFVLTFGGDWSTLVTSKPAQIRVALQRGIAKLLNVAEYVIRVLSFKSGTLIVEFAVLDPSVEANTVQATLQNAVGNSATLATAFAELQTAAGFAIELTAVAAPEGSTLAPLTPAPQGTPAPGTPVPGTPAPGTPGSSASAVSAVVAVALVAMSLLF